ncbi:MAG TPA: hypothetical protein VMU18_07465 [Rhodoblastus sp.]|nr:hypothetical protein [Rhodoblastus sp.]
MHLMRSAILGTAFLALCAGAVAARPLKPAEQFFSLPYDGRMPPCDDGVSLYEISQRFASAEAFSFNSPLRITGFAEIRETGFRPNGPDFVPRRYCAARAMFNDNRERVIRYFIIERGGFMGFNRGVQWCVVGLDRYRAFAPNCELAEPNG